MTLGDEMKYTREQIEDCARDLKEESANAENALFGSNDKAALMLRQLLAENEALREDAAKNRIDADCFRWWVHEAAVNPSLVAKAISHCTTEEEYREVICGAMSAKDAVINAARKENP